MRLACSYRCCQAGFLESTANADGLYPIRKASNVKTFGRKPLKAQANTGHPDFHTASGKTRFTVKPMNGWKGFAKAIENRPAERSRNTGCRR